MIFLQPWILAALPIIALPIIIHLINQNRHKTVPWGATRFLLHAQKMARGMARLRYILILLARMLAVAGLLFALSRPMASGWSMLSAGGAETTIILLDRSASMEQTEPSTGYSKRQTAIEKIREFAVNTGSSSKCIVIDSVTLQPLELESADKLLELPMTQPTATSADIPAMVNAAIEYMTVNQLGSTDIWLCSDLQASNWDIDGGRWQAIRDQLAKRDGARVYLLNYQHVDEANLSVTVSNVQRRKTGEASELVMDIQVDRTTPSTNPLTVPLTLLINGARSTLEVELSGQQFLKAGHTIPIDSELTKGWGRVELPSDASKFDNVFDFTFAEPAARKTSIVSDNPAVSNLLKLAMTTSSDPSIAHTAEIFTSQAAAVLDWNQSAMIIWQAALPEADLARQLEAFVNSGRTVLFLPPDEPTSAELFGNHWTGWATPEGRELWRVGYWKTESDLLCNTRGGETLPVGEIEVTRMCRLKGEGTTSLARLDGEGGSLLTRVPTDHGSVYFLQTLPSVACSNFASNGIALYVMLHRELSQGAAALQLAQTQNCHAESLEKVASWEPVDDLAESTLISERSLNPGIYRLEERLIALNRPVIEDDVARVDQPKLNEILEGIDITVINDQAGSASALASEVWRYLVIAMIIALLAEGLLCMPERSKEAESSRAKFPRASSFVNA